MSERKIKAAKDFGIVSLAIALMCGARFAKYHVIEPMIGLPGSCVPLLPLKNLGCAPDALLGFAGIVAALAGIVALARAAFLAIREARRK